MADNYLQTSFVVKNLTNKEIKWLNVKLAEDPSEIYGDDLIAWNKEWELEDAMAGWGFDTEINPKEKTLWCFGEEYVNVQHLGAFLNHFLRVFRENDTITFTYSYTCSKLRLEEFGGGCVVITADDLRILDSVDIPRILKLTQTCRELLGAMP
jgi:hypothetical protein